MNLHAFPDTTYTWLDGTTEPISVQVEINGDFDFDVVSNTWWGVAGFDLVLFDKNGAPLITAPDWLELPLDADDDGIADGWEDENGGRSLSNPSAPCTGPSAECDDTDWDGEATGSAHEGDGFTKMEEYQGVMVGTDHHRLLPHVPEILLDISSPLQKGGEVQIAAQWAANELVSQLGIEPHVDFGIDGLKDDLEYQGNKMLHRLGEGASDPTRGYVKLVAAGTVIPNPLATIDVHVRQVGLIGNNTHYFWGGTVVEDDSNCPNVVPGTKIQTCQPVPSWWDLKYDIVVLGGTRAESQLPGFDGYWVSRVYDDTIFNLFNSNLITESVTNHLFWWSIATPTGPETYNAYFDNADVDGQGGKSAANPFELLFNPYVALTRSGTLRNIKNNDQTLTEIAGITEADQLKRTMLHELGHAVGIWVLDPLGCSALRDLPNLSSHLTRRNCHPESYPSVMRSGIGPGKIASFDPRDKQTVNLRR